MSTATENRQPRAQQTREADDVHEQYNVEWESPALLDTKNIPARPGYVQRWVRTKLNGEDDQNNVFRKINQGWRPRQLDSVPKGQFIPHVDFNGMNVIGIHGMILMERPEQLHEKQAAYNRAQADNQMQAVKNNLFSVHQQSNRGFVAPSMRNSSEVSRGRLVSADDD